ncbi:STAS domain-containing protein [Micromonospora sp. PLK6-60]|uniref:STAS domain-containing protein n=1 Tax=Micromonospora sp. PLK6-60 TaxID=2873383 RepID=UPI001CA70A83|nr:STAS domain-containing protein [Micromonospora sp. PLK6-60]MBY8875939.1 STAS domain-containing protein [Micromonospora sp. PLK6-60]
MDVAVRDAAGGRVLLCPAGEIDMSSADALEAALRAAVRRTGARDVLVDLSRVAFLDSAGIRALLRGAQAGAEHAVRVRVTEPQPVVARILRITGVGPLLGWADGEAYRADGRARWRRFA